MKRVVLPAIASHKQCRRAQRVGVAALLHDPAQSIPSLSNFILRDEDIVFGEADPPWVHKGERSPRRLLNALTRETRLAVRTRLREPWLQRIADHCKIRPAEAVE